MSLIYLDENNFEKEVEQSDIPVLVDFWAEWCGPCKMMGPVFEELSGEYEGKLKFAKLNVDEQRNLGGRYSVSGIPSLLLLEKGKETNRLVGFMPKDILKQKIDGLL